KVSDHRRSEGTDRSHRNQPIPAPCIDRPEKAGRTGGGVTGPAQQFGYTIALGCGAGGFRRAASRGLDTTGVGNGLAFAENFHGQVPHRLEAQRQAFEILTAHPIALPSLDLPSLDLPGLIANSGDGLREIHLTQVLLYCLTIDVLAGNATGLPHPRRRGSLVGRRQWLIREPRVGDESSRARGTHDIATPKRVDTENCICDKSCYRVHGALLIFLLRTLFSVSRTIRTHRGQQTAARKRFGTLHCSSKKASGSDPRDIREPVERPHPEHLPTRHRPSAPKQ